MSISSLLEPAPNIHTNQQELTAPDVLTETILGHLQEQTVIGMDSLTCFMPQYSWNQIFNCVDQLARRNKIVLRRHGFSYTIFSVDFIA
ncbi:MAG: hypothetical protein OEV08_09060 [Nitrospira sp.]|nr:hypothetical protein [Nitrospira sp.]